MKACPECQQQFEESDEFCPHHGVKLLALQAVASGGGTVDRVTPPPGPPTVQDGEAIIGTVLDGRYLIERRLGEGGMGVVYLGRHTVIEKVVAIKILKREVARDGSVVKRFLQEARAASRIGHPNIVDVTDFGTLPDGSVFSVMEYIPGFTLARVLRDGPMPLSRALPIVGQIARALGAAHDKGVVHRDLKPENIFLLERDGRKDFVKIVDFGIAKMAPLEGPDAPRLTRAGSVFGTPEYMAPEQAAGRSDTDHRVDIYALGTIFYEMIVGQVPHKGESVVATLAMQMLDPVVPPRQAAPHLAIDDAVEAVVMKTLAKEREQRWSSMSEFIAALELAAGGIPVDPLAFSQSQRVLTGVGAPSTYSSGAIASMVGAGASSAPATTPDAPRLRPLTPVPIPTAGPGAPTTPSPPFAAAGITVSARTASAGATPGAGPAARQPGAPSVPIADVTEPVPSFAAARAAEDGRARSRRYGAAAGVIAILAVGAVAAALVLSGDADGGADGPVASGGGVPVPLAPDAGAPVATASTDAAVARTGGEPDAATQVATPDGPPDAGATRRPPRPSPSPSHAATPSPSPSIRTPEPGGAVNLVVRTNPAGGELRVGGAHAGTDGTTFHRPRGTVLTVECVLADHVPGAVKLVFDGRTTEATCTMRKKPRCVEQLQNPFEPCPPPRAP